VLFFPNSHDVNAECSGKDLNLTLAAKYPKVQRKTDQLFEKYGATYKDLCKRLVELGEEQRELGKLKSWEEANQPAVGAVKNQTELSAHVELFKKCKDRGMPVPVLPEHDGEVFDWTWRANEDSPERKVQSQVSDVGTSDSWRIGPTRVLWVYENGQSINKEVTYSYGDYDFLYTHRSDGTFFLIPKEVMRRHGAFLGQEFPLPPVGKGKSRQTKAEDERYLGRTTVQLFPPGDSPRKVKTTAWQKLCAKYCLSWNSTTVRTDVETVLLEYF
jgi:hypothetical protein